MTNKIVFLLLLFADPEGLQAQAEEGARFGYTGESVFCPHFSLLFLSGQLVSTLNLS